MIALNSNFALLAFPYFPHTTGEGWIVAWGSPAAAGWPVEDKLQRVHFWRDLTEQFQLLLKELYSSQL